jgi:hypothetical protein
VRSRSVWRGGGVDSLYLYSLPPFFLFGRRRRRRRRGRGVTDQAMDEENMTKSEEQQPLSLQKALQQCELVQNMIDLSISNLEGLRTKCATSNDLTQKEIRTLEVGVAYGQKAILLSLPSPPPAPNPLTADSVCRGQEGGGWVTRWARLVPCVGCPFTVRLLSVFGWAVVVAVVIVIPYLLSRVQRLP